MKCNYLFKNWKNYFEFSTFTFTSHIKGYNYLKDLPADDRNLPPGFLRGEYYLQFIVFTKQKNIDELLLITTFSFKLRNE